MVQKVKFEVKSRTKAGKGVARATRRQGLMPAVIYGAGKEPEMIAMDTRPIWKALEGGQFYSNVYEISIDGKKNETALARDIQFHPVTDQPLHVDFLRVSERTKVNVAVSVHFINEEISKGLKAGGILNIVRHEIELYSRVDAIPSHIELDLANAEVGDSLKLSDVTLPAGVTSTIHDRDFTIATIAAPKTATITEDEEETTTTEEAPKEE